jgi:uncharacterized protein YbjT (DUF2867 family)
MEHDTDSSKKTDGGGPVVVTGASGKTGGAVARLLAAAGQPYRLLARRSDATLNAAAVVHGDYDDVDSLAAAFAGAQAVYAVTPIHPRQVAWMRNLVDAAARAGVQRFVKLSGMTAGPESPSALMRDHGTSDDYLRASGVPYTILQPNSFMQNILMSLDSIKNQSAFYLATGNARQSTVDLVDVAAVAVNSLIRPTGENATHVLTGPQSLTFDQIAARVGQHLKRSVTYVPVSTDAAQQGMRAAGLPDWTAHAVAEFFGSVATGAYAEVTSDVEKVLGRAATSFEQFLTREQALFQ